MSLCYNSYDREDFLAEFLHQLFRVDWADAFDQAAAEVFLNALPRRGRAALEKRGFKLQSVLFVLHPVALSSNPLARVDARKGSNHRHQLPVALHLYTQHRKPRLFAVEGDALDQSRESLLWRRWWRGVHAGAGLSNFWVKTRALILYPAKCSMKRILSELNPHCWPTSKSFRISERIYSLKLIESELAFRFASRCNAAGKVLEDQPPEIFRAAARALLPSRSRSVWR